MSAQVTINQLPAAGTITGNESVPIVQDGQTVRTTTAAIASAPSQTQTFITLFQEATLPNSRYLGATNGLTLSASSPQGVLNITTTGALLSLLNSGTGLQVKTDSATLTSRTIVAGTAGLSVTNGDGVSGNPTVSLSGQILNFANASANGILTLTTGGTVSSTQIAGSANQISVTNGDGIAGSPTVAIADNPVLPGTGSVTLPQGTSGQQPFGSQGQIRFNTTTQTFDGYSSGAWRTFSTTGGVTTFSAGTTGLLPSSAQAGVITLSGTLNVANGGTGATTLTGYLVGNGTSAFSAVATIPNAGLTNSAITINGSTVSLGGSVTVTATASSALTIGTGLSGTSYNGSAPVTIAISSTGVTAASYGSATQVGTFTVNAQGQLTAAGNTTVTPAVGSITGLGTGVATALAVNTSSVGSFVVNGGALGTPSGGTVTNLTGTASININGTVGATTATTGAFTTVSASGVITSTVATGTAPFTVASTTAVANLSIGGNAATATNVALTAGSGATNYIHFSSVATGNQSTNTSTSLTFNATTGSITGGISGGTF